MKDQLVEKSPKSEQPWYVVKRWDVVGIIVALMMAALIITMVWWHSVWHFDYGDMIKAIFSSGD